MGILNIEHAKTDLDFEASSWDDVLKDTVTFYEKARHNHTKERDMGLWKINLTKTFLYRISWIIEYIHVYCIIIPIHLLNSRLLPRSKISCASP